MSPGLFPWSLLLNHYRPPPPSVSTSTYASSLSTPLSTPDTSVPPSPIPAPQRPHHPHSSAIHPSRPSEPYHPQRHIEIIGGTSSPPPLPPHRHPRLPPELIVAIVSLAASSLLHHADTPSSSSEGVQRALSLCTVSCACFRTIMATHLLPEVHLYGVCQVLSFCRALRLDRCGLRALAASRMRTLVVRLDDKTRRGGSTPVSKGNGPALFDAATAQAHFERATSDAITDILVACPGIEHLALECMPRALDLSPLAAAVTPSRARTEAIDRFTSRVRTLSCHLSIYAGRYSDDFWHPSLSPSAPDGRWASLERLHLYGPRLRFTKATAEALARLPRLVEVMLVMPLLVHPSATNGEDSGAGAEVGLDLDMEGRPNVLQRLASGCKHLRMLVVVGHEARDYVGNAERYRTWLRAIYRPVTLGAMGVQLVTLRVRGGRGRDVHPSVLARWTMDRHERRWAVEGDVWGEIPTPMVEDELGEEGEDIDYTTETWALTRIYPSQYHREPPEAGGTEAVGGGVTAVSPVVDGEGVDRAEDGGGEDEGREEAEEVWGIDNLD